MTPEEFVARWRPFAGKETSGYQSHFDDLCRMLGHDTPAAADPTASFFCFQKAVAKNDGRAGFADVFYRRRPRPPRVRSRSAPSSLGCCGRAPQLLQPLAKVRHLASGRSFFPGRPVRSAPSKHPNVRERAMAGRWRRWPSYMNWTMLPYRRIEIRQ